MKRAAFAIVLSTTMLLTVGQAAADPPPYVPLQGYLTDTGGAPIDGMVQMLFRLYDTGGTSLYCESKSVPVDNGEFDLRLGLDVPIDLDADLVVGQPTEIGVTIGGGNCSDAPTVEEMRYPLGTVPYAAQAQHAVAADTALAATTATTATTAMSATTAATATNVDWSGIQNVPSDIADGDANTTYTNGTGIGLSGTTFSLDTTFADGRYVNAGATDSVSSAMISDGTVTTDDVADGSLGAADLDESSGLYLSRDGGALYFNIAAVNLAAGQADTVIAMCNDANDIPISGGCDSVPTVELYKTTPNTWTNTASNAAYTCGGYNRDTGPHSLSSIIYCISVP